MDNLSICKSSNVHHLDLCNDLHPAVKDLDFERLKWKLSQSSEAKMTQKECEFAEQEYKRFLTLKKLYPKRSLVPNKIIDDFWHAHILDTAAYQKDCEKVFGYFLHHFPYFGIYGEEDKQNLEKSFEETKKLYEKHFGAYPKKIDSASRCEGKPCHAPTDCRCR